MSARSRLVGTKILLALFGGIPGIFVLHGPNKTTNVIFVAFFPWWANEQVWALAAIHPRWGNR